MFGSLPLLCGCFAVLKLIHPLARALAWTDPLAWADLARLALAPVNLLPAPLVMLACLVATYVGHERAHWLGYYVTGQQDVITGRAFSCPSGLMTRWQYAVANLAPYVVLGTAYCLGAVWAWNSDRPEFSGLFMLLFVVTLVMGGAADHLLLYQTLRLPAGAQLQFLRLPGRCEFQFFVPAAEG